MILSTSENSVIKAMTRILPPHLVQTIEDRGHVPNFGEFGTCPPFNQAAQPLEGTGLKSSHDEKWTPGQSPGPRPTRSSRTPSREKGEWNSPGEENFLRISLPN